MTSEERRVKENQLERDRIDLIFFTIKRFFIGVVLGQFLLFAILVVTLHTGRQSQIENSRAGCERGKLDRASIVVIASGVSDGFKNTDARFHNKITLKRKNAENQIRLATDSLASRTGNRLNCRDAFPNASWWPWAQTTTRAVTKPKT